MTSHLDSSLIEFAVRCLKGDSATALIPRFKEICFSFGLQHVACGAWTGSGNQQAARFFFNDWPEAWLAQYTAHRYVVHDPFVEQAKRSVVPFVLSDMPLDSFSKENRKVHDAAMAFGWKEVVGIPIHGPGGYQGLISLGSMRSLSVSARELASLDIIGRAIHHVCRTDVSCGHSNKALPQLSTRELEAMRWVASGKTDAEIATLMAIRPVTAHFHVENVKRKLDCRSRAEAVSVLFLYGMI